MHVSGNAYNPYGYLYTRATGAADVATKSAERTASSGSPDQAKNSAAVTGSSKALTSDSVNGTLLRQQEEGASSKYVMLDTGRGKQAMDIDAYFTPKSGRVNLDDVPLLLFSDHNIDALSAHASDKMKAFLKEHEIPAGPDKITYDNEGQINLPPDYPYAAEFEQALEDDPAMARELQTISALTSHNAAIQKAMNGGGYSNVYAEIALNFADDGTLSITANGKPYKGDEAEEGGAGLSTSKAGEGADDVSASADSESDPVKEFLDFMSMTPEERYYAMFLAEEGLTPEELEALPPEERAKIEEIIRRKIEERVALDVEQAAGSTASTTPSLEQYQLPEWMTEYGVSLSTKLGTPGSEVETAGAKYPTGGSASEKAEYNARVRGHYEAVLKEAGIETIDDHYQQLVQDKSRSQELQQRMEERIAGDGGLMGL